MLVEALYSRLHRKQLDKSAAGGHLYQILVEKDAMFKPAQYNNLFDSLHTIYRDAKPWQWVSFEFHGTRRGIELYVWATNEVSQEFLQSNINAIHPAAEIYLIDESLSHVDTYIAKKDYTKILLDREPLKYTCATLELEYHYLFNLLQSTGDRAGAADMMASLCASMQNLDETEEVCVQFTLRPIGSGQINSANSYFDIYKQTGYRPKKVHLPYSPYAGYLATPNALGASIRYSVMGTAGAKDVSTSVNSMRSKVEEGGYFDTNIRIAVYHDDYKKGKARLSTIISAFAPATDKNRFRPYTKYREILNKGWKHIFDVKEITKFLSEYQTRKVYTYPAENYLSPSELATILHFPSKDIPGLIRLRAKKLPVPDGIHTYDTLEAAWKDQAIVFGTSNFRGRNKYLAFTDLKMLMQHLYLIGGTGSGKSVWLSFIAIQLIRLKLCGIIFYDVKGDIADELLKRIPKSELSRVHYIDLQDCVRFMPLNFLRQEGMSVYNLATMIVGVFLKLNSAGSIKEHSEGVLRRALIAVISTNPEGSILEVCRMFTDPDYLDWTITQMEQKTEYPDVLQYWEDFRDMKPAARKSEAGAIINKIEIITQNEGPRWSLCQKENALNWRKLIDEKAIIVINYALDVNEPKIVSFFGTLFTAFINKAIFSRGDMPVKDRVPTVLFLDEFEMFVKQQEDMQKFLELARSYGLGLILAHQSVEQLPSQLMGMIADNTFTQISLSIGDESSTKIKRMFPGIEEEDLTSMLPYTGYARFKKINPAPFTFSAINTEKIFTPMSNKELNQFKESYKNNYYREVKSIKQDILQRYALTRISDIDTDVEVAIKKGKASGKIKRKEG